MPTYISILNWSGEPQPLPSDIRNAVLIGDQRLRDAGLYSLALLPGEGACAAIIVATTTDADAVTRIAESILPHATIRIDTMRFDDDPTEPDGTREAVCPPPPRDYLSAVLEAVAAG